MLTTLIDRLTTFGSKQFVTGAFLPVLVFAFLNGTLLYRVFHWFHDWANPQISGTSRAFDVAAVAVGLAVVAYVLWSVNGFLTALLEGRHLTRPRWILRTLGAAELQRFRNLGERYRTARNTAAELAAKEADWTKTLSDAAIQGLKTTNATSAQVPNPSNTYTRGSAAGTLVTQLERKRAQADDISKDELQAAVDAFAAVLNVNNLKVPQATNPLALDRRELVKLIEYAKLRWIAREVALANDLQWRFGLQEVAPTAFGNVALALQNYGLTRYGISVATFWSRLQNVLQTDKETIGTIQEAKAQLDFLVCSCWLAMITTALWGILLPVYGTPALFALTMIGGACVARVCYLAAVENYIAFGEIVRSSVDLHRLRLLEALHLRRPTSLRDEREMWKALQLVVAFGQETIDIGYHYSPGTKA